MNALRTGKPLYVLERNVGAILVQEEFYFVCNDLEDTGKEIFRFHTPWVRELFWAIHSKSAYNRSTEG